MKVTIKNIINFIKGYSRMYRYRLARKIMKSHAIQISFLKPHVVEQFQERINKADIECVESGKCKACGCHTPELFFIEDACKGGCYPAMLTEKEWNTQVNKL